MADISLTASMRSNLLSLKNTQSLMDMTQERLSTGKKVNSAIDNPSSYYAAQSLSNRASDLSALMDSMGQAIQTIKAADEGIKTITAFAEQAKAVANSARDVSVPEKVEGAVKLDTGAKAAVDDTITFTVTDKDGKTSEVLIKFTAATTNEAGTLTALKGLITTADKGFSMADDGTITADAGVKVALKGATGDNLAGKVSFSGSSSPQAADVAKGQAERSKLVSQFNNILDQLDKVAKDSGYKGVNLLQSNNLTVIFNEDRSSQLTVAGKDASSGGLGLTQVADWNSAANIDTTITQVEAAINTLREISSEFGNNYSIVQNRESFTDNLINVLTEGADKLTLADMNEESANMLALQTRQQLAVNSLSLASQAQQSVLKLF